MSGMFASSAAGAGHEKKGRKPHGPGYVNQDLHKTGGERDKLTPEELAEKLKMIRIQNEKIKQKREEVDADAAEFEKSMAAERQAEKAQREALAARRRQQMLQSSVDEERKKNAQRKLEKVQGREWDAKMTPEELGQKLETIRIQNEKIQQKREQVGADAKEFERSMAKELVRNPHGPGYVNQDRHKTGGERDKLTPEELAEKMRMIRIQNEKIKQKREEVDAAAEEFEKSMAAERQAEKAQREALAARRRQQPKLQSSVDEERKIDAQRKMEKVLGGEWDAQREEADWNHPDKPTRSRGGFDGRGGRRGRGKRRGKFNNGSLSRQDAPKTPGPSDQNNKGQPPDPPVPAAKEECVMSPGPPNQNNQGQPPDWLGPAAKDKYVRSPGPSNQNNKGKPPGLLTPSNE